jgi:Mg-chelatase subunit ChlD
VAQAAIHDLGAALGSTPDGRAQLVRLLRSLRTAPAQPNLPTDPPNLGLLTTEREVWAANKSAEEAIYRAVRPSAGGTSMDYPFVVLTDDPRLIAVADTLLAALSAPGAQRELERLGFRPASQPAAALTRAGARTAMASVATLQLPIRTLAVVDVSGSMALPVPGGGGATRLDLAREALGGGLGLLPSDSVAGLWRFSANLTPSTDFEQLAPLTRLTPSARRRLEEAVKCLKVDADGGTGLYSSTLAAVRHVRATYDPSRVNSVVVLTDGRDQDATAHAVSLSTLLTTLEEEADPTRPVQVIGVVYGPDADSAAMRAITTATGGPLYIARNPRDLHTIFQDALGRRLCGSEC